ncbi:acyl-homoserine-lactone synthase [Pseudomonas sp. PB3P13]
MDKVSFYKADYSDASQELMGNLFRLRKEVFADRLDWRVIVNEGREIDEYDNAFSTYLVGVYAGMPLASLRLINTQNPYMVEGPFRGFFNCTLPKDRLIAESSRFFVDKTRSRALGLSKAPITEMLLLAMHDHATQAGLVSIITVVSQAMSRIVLRAGWQYEVLATGEASPGEKVLLLNMPVRPENARRLKEVIESKCKHPLRKTLEVNC